MNKLTAFALSISALALGCATSPTPVDPVGTWRLTDTWTTGTCAVTGTAPHTLYFSADPGGNFHVEDADTSVTSVAGSTACDETMCAVTLTEVATASGGTATGTLTLTLDDADDVHGGGTVQLRTTAGATCSKAFTSAGRKR